MAAIPNRGTLESRSARAHVPHLDATEILERGADFFTEFT